MKKISIVIIACFAAFTSLHAQTKSCCTIGVTTQNAMLASNTDFARTHQEPLAYTLENPTGEMITLKTTDGVDANAYLIKSKEPSDKYLFVFHEWWGLNDHIKRETEHLYSSFKNVNVIAIDLYDGKIGGTREEAQKLMTHMTEVRSKTIVEAAFNFVGPKAQVATYGWCMGGAWSLQAALIGQKQVKACVMYYGMPEANIARLKTLNCEVLGIFANDDKFINTELVNTFKSNMKKAGEKLTVYSYAADHAFANPSNPGFNKTATEDAFAKACAFLVAQFGVSKN